jgi:hypothetical protein
MFNTKLKQELIQARQTIEARNKEIRILEVNAQDNRKEIENLKKFNKFIEDKIEELCKPKINDFCLSMIGSGMVVSGDEWSSSINILNKSYESLKGFLESQAKDLERLKQGEEDTKKILFLAGKVEQLINKLNKK